jgi:peptidoglycan-N-acetylglucosamine deacetylase
MSAPDHRTPIPRLLGGAAVLAMAGYALPALAQPWPALRRRLGIEDRTASGRGYALTFDDGPHPQGTPAILELLAQRGVPATFFLVGEQVARDPALAREVVAAGHEVGLHCHRHRNLLRLGPAQVREDIARAQATIEEATERATAIYRPPYGVLNACALRLAQSRGWRTLLWSHWGRDWEAQATPASILALATAGAGDGAVLLLHDADDYSAAGSWQRSAAALPQIIDTLAERGLQPAPA